VGGAHRTRTLASLLIAALGWREPYLVLGGLAVVVGAGMALLIENDPRDRGLGPDGDPLQLDAESVRPSGASVREAITSRSTTPFRAFAGYRAKAWACEARARHASDPHAAPILRRSPSYG
jgi:hypothetical protein